MSLQSTKINHGTIHTTKDAAGNVKFIAVSHLEETTEGLMEPFWLFSTAAFYLWLIEARVMGRRYRMGE